MSVLLATSSRDVHQALVKTLQLGEHGASLFAGKVWGAPCVALHMESPDDDITLAQLIRALTPQHTILVHAREHQEHKQDDDKHGDDPIPDPRIVWLASEIRSRDKSPIRCSHPLAQCANAVPRRTSVHRQSFDTIQVRPVFTSVEDAPAEIPVVPRAFAFARTVERAFKVPSIVVGSNADAAASFVFALIEANTSYLRKGA